MPSRAVTVQGGLWGRLKWLCCFLEDSEKTYLLVQFGGASKPLGRTTRWFGGERILPRGNTPARGGGRYWRYFRKRGRSALIEVRIRDCVFQPHELLKPQ